MKKESAQSLLLVLVIVIIFTAMVVIIAGTTTRELEFREIGEAGLRADYAAESGYERAKMLLMKVPPTTQVKIKKEACPNPDADPPILPEACVDYCPDSTVCNTTDCNCDKNPMTNGYGYLATITPYGKWKDGTIGDCYSECPINKNCCCEQYCIDTGGSF